MSPTKKGRRAPARLLREALSLCVLVMLAVTAPTWVPAVFVPAAALFADLVVPLLTAGFTG